MGDSSASRTSARHGRLHRAPVLLGWRRNGTRQWRGGKFDEASHRDNGVQRRRTQRPRRGELGRKGGRGEGQGLGSAFEADARWVRVPTVPADSRGVVARAIPWPRRPVGEEDGSAKRAPQVGETGETRSNAHGRLPGGAPLSARYCTKKMGRARVGKKMWNGPS
jgi:hypothetical protein